LLLEIGAKNQSSADKIRNVKKSDATFAKDVFLHLPVRETRHEAMLYGM